MSSSFGHSKFSGSYRNIYIEKLSWFIYLCKKYYYVQDWTREKLDLLIFVGKREDFLSFDQLIDEESMDFFQSDEYLMMSKHLNPSFSEGKVSFQVSLLFLVFGPLNQTGRLSGLASQPVPQTLGP